MGKNILEIKRMKKPEFKIFLDKKIKFEQRVLAKKKIIVTTVGKGCTRMFRNRKFKRVIMDEATMIRENEAFLTMLDAEQIVLVGDQEQLGPTLRFKIEGPSSMFSRLIQANHPYDFLDT